MPPARFLFQLLLGSPDRAGSVMAQDAWYRRKAEECARMAEQATEHGRCAEYRRQERLWRQIADQVSESRAKCQRVKERHQARYG